MGNKKTKRRRITLLSPGGFCLDTTRPLSIFDIKDQKPMRRKNIEADNKHDPECMCSVPYLA
jgi:hypothetical protein